MILPVDEKNLKIIQIGIGFCLRVEEKTEQFTQVSIYKAYFTNARAI